MKVSRTSHTSRRAFLYLLLLALVVSAVQIATTTSALLRWLSPRPFEPRAGPPETTRLGSRLPDVPLQFEAVQNQIRSAKLPLGSGVARVEQQ